MAISILIESKDFLEIYGEQWSDLAMYSSVTDAWKGLDDNTLLSVYIDKENDKFIVTRSDNPNNDPVTIIDSRYESWKAIRFLVEENVETVFVMFEDKKYKHLIKIFINKDNFVTPNISEMMNSLEYLFSYLVNKDYRMMITPKIKSER